MRDPPFFFTFSDLGMTERLLTSDVTKAFGERKDTKKTNKTGVALGFPYSHAVEGQLAVDLELVGRGHPPAGVHQ